MRPSNGFKMTCRHFDTNNINKIKTEMPRLYSLLEKKKKRNSPKTGHKINKAYS